MVEEKVDAGLDGEAKGGRGAAYRKPGSTLVDTSYLG
jgi:hypothetical protein